MPRIIVTAEPLPPQVTDERPVLLDEQVHSVYLSTGHAAAQLIERLAWAITDAEEAEGPRPRLAHPVGEQAERSACVGDVNRASGPQNARLAPRSP
jgi:hypothetical protein